MKKILRTVLILGLLILPKTALADSTYSDISGHMYEDSINEITQQGIVQGYNDNTYRPDKEISRAELLKIVVKSVYKYEDYSPYEENMCFWDISSIEWYNKYLCFAEANGIVNGYEDGTFRPERNISFAEALKITMKSFDMPYSENANPWYAEMTEKAEESDLIPDDVRDYESNITRGQMADLITRIQGVEEEENKIIDEYEEEEVTLREGTEVTLENNITIKVKKIEEPFGGTALIYTEHFINGKQLDLMPKIHRLSVKNGDIYNEDYDYRIEIRNFHPDDKEVEVVFIPLTIPVYTPEDLYNECMKAKGREFSCADYTLLYPLSSETQINTDHFQIFGPREARNYLEDMADLFEEYYDDLSEELQIEPLQKNIPIHFIDGNSSVVTTSVSSGIKWRITETKNDKNYDGDISIRSKNTIAHELVHHYIGGISFDVLNEGLATYVSHKLVNNDNFSCNGNSYERYEEEYDFGKLNMYSQIPYREGGSDLYFTSACFWEEYESDNGTSAFLDTIKIIDEQRNIIEGRVSLLDLIEEELEIDMDYYREKYGFDYIPPEGKYDSTFGVIAEYLFKSGMSYGMCDWKTKD